MWITVDYIEYYGGTDGDCVCYDDSRTSAETIEKVKKARLS